MYDVSCWFLLCLTQQHIDESQIKYDSYTNQSITSKETEFDIYWQIVKGTANITKEVFLFLSDLLSVLFINVFFKFSARRIHIEGGLKLPADEYHSFNFVFINPHMYRMSPYAYRTLDILQHFYFEANYIKIFAKYLIILELLTLYAGSAKYLFFWKMF